MIDVERLFMDAMIYTMEGKDPTEAIDLEQKRKQNEICRLGRIPIVANFYSVPDDVRMNGIEEDMEYEEREKIVRENNKKWTREQYEKMGIVINEEIDYYLYSVTLPEGWEVKSTDHAMWNKLVDNKGRKRASFFEGPFYDRDSFVNFEARFRISTNRETIEHDDGSKTKGDWFVAIYDGEAVLYPDEVIRISHNDKNFHDKEKDAREQLNHVLKEKYPNYEDFTAYWDEE